MDQETFDKANALVRKIKELKRALELFEWSPGEGCEPISTNPKIIIEYEHCDGPEQHKLPITLNEAFIARIKGEIIYALDEAQKEFESL